MAFKIKKTVIHDLQGIPAAETWIFKPENREILKAVKEGLKQKGTVKWGSFAKYLKSK